MRGLARLATVVLLDVELDGPAWHVDGGRRVADYLSQRDLFVQDLYVGADPQYRMPVPLPWTAAMRTAD